MFIEGLGSASVANGVVRIQTVYHGAKGETVPGEELFIPASRVIAVSEELQGLISKMRDQEAAAAAAAATAAEGKGAE